MTVVGICRCKDEEDIIASSVQQMLTQVDIVYVWDNNSTDSTWDILLNLQSQYGGRRLSLYQDTEAAYYQSRKMTDMATQAHDQWGAEWVVPFDADEIWYSPFGRIGDILSSLALQWLVVRADLYDHVATGANRAVSGDPVKEIGWRRIIPAPLPKVACRYREDLIIEAGNHGALYQGGASVHPEILLVVRHFPYRSKQQFVRKATNGYNAYKLTDLDESVGAHWRQYGQIIEANGEEAGWEIFEKWFYVAFPDINKEGIIYDQAPVSYAVDTA